jgi:hypothetical protein
VQRRQHALAVSLRGVSPSGRLGQSPSGRLGSVVWGNGRRRLGSYINNDWPNLAVTKIPYALSFDPIWGASVGPQLSGLGDTPPFMPGPVADPTSDPTTNLTPFPLTPTSITTYPGANGSLTVTNYGSLLPNTGPGGISLGTQPPPQPPQQPGFFAQMSAFFSKPISAGSSITMGHITAGGAFLMAMAGVSKGKGR